jgi:arabinan endo-1,5-alpha-L-arabinosidase
MAEDTLLKDAAGGQRAGHDGLVVVGQSSTPWAAGKLGAALRLGGVEAGTYARVPDFPLATNNALSVCGWVLAQSRPRWASIAKNWAKDQGKDFGGQFHFGLRHDLGSLEVHVHDRARKEVYASDVAPFPLNQWQFVAFTLDGETLRLYRNGELVAATPCAGLSTFAPAALGIGVKLDGTGLRPERNTPGFWDGLIDELAIFDFALSERQIRNLSEASLGVPPQP